MKKSDMTYIIGAVFVSMTGLFYCSVSWFGIKLPRYYPTEHVWKMVKEKGVPSQGWYGMQAFAFICAGIVSLIVWLVLKKLCSKDFQLSDNTTKLLGAASTVIMLFAMGYIMYHEYSKWGVF